MLTIAGLDVIVKPGTAGSKYGVPQDTIVWTERGAGGVSELAFTIEDPLAEISVTRGDLVQFRDITADAILFTGFPSSVTPRPWQPTGRYIDVICLGLEKVLDWAKLPAMTLAAGLDVGAAVQSLVAAAVAGLAFPLKALQKPAGFVEGEFDYPVGQLWGGTLDPASPLVIVAGTSLREGIRQVLEDTVQAYDTNGALCTVDAYSGLRLYPDQNGGTLRLPSDWTSLAVSDFTSAAFRASSELNYEADLIGSPVAVQVIGAAGAVTIVTDGTGDAGDTATISDTGLDTVLRRTGAGRSYLGQTLEPARGSLDLDVGAIAVPANVHAGGKVNVLDALIGLPNPGAEFRIAEITRRYVGTAVLTRVVFGGRSPSIAGLLRRLTRTLPN